MLSQLDCEEHKPMPCDIDQKNHTMRRRVASTLAANMTFNTVNLPTQFLKHLFNQTTFSITHHWKSLFYQVANALYYNNIFLVLEIVSIDKSQDYVNRSLFTTLNAVNSFGALAPYTEPIFVISYATRRTTKTVKNNSIPPY